MPITPTIESKTLNFKNSPIALAYAAVVDHVKEKLPDQCQDDPESPAVTVRVESSPYKFDPAVLQNLPLLIIECGGGPIDDRTAITDDESFAVAFTVFVANGNHIDLLNFEKAVRRTINPRAVSWLETALGESAELADIGWKAPAVTYEPVKESRVLKATATLRIRIAVKDC